MQNNKNNLGPSILFLFLRSIMSRLNRRARECEQNGFVHGKRVLQMRRQWKLGSVSPPTRVYSSFLLSSLSAVALRHKKGLIARSLSPPFLHFLPSRWYLVLFLFNGLPWAFDIYGFPHLSMVLWRSDMINNVLVFYIPGSQHVKRWENWR